MRLAQLHDPAAAKEPAMRDALVTFFVEKMTPVMGIAEARGEGREGGEEALKSGDDYRLGDQTHPVRRS